MFPQSVENPRHPPRLNLWPAPLDSGVTFNDPATGQEISMKVHLLGYGSAAKILRVSYRVPCDRNHDFKSGPALVISSSRVELGNYHFLRPCSSRYRAHGQLPYTGS
ncbi:hypothetical protein PGT21_033311 [Puccinia graminis f. sp. tritici]|uniref:Uncharacterized protein n=1 Tax=Puccinia graminis f. sp. tritici TaxID=56615 RepID=A0A5B0N893_PUCGR|nr:hypothetical protein PGTUg99_001854 [Puccinia graminis f. sp. tritici]KAA1084634.1 hypothetical protein PGT21_033311 [Puccinia graminis f. sp. tritici]